MNETIYRKTVDFKKLTQHERVVFFRAKKMRMTIEDYARKFGSKNLPHLIS